MSSRANETKSEALSTASGKIAVKALAYETRRFVFSSTSLAKRKSNSARSVLFVRNALFPCFVLFFFVGVCMMRACVCVRVYVRLLTSVKKAEGEESEEEEEEGRVGDK